MSESPRVTPQQHRFFDRYIELLGNKGAGTQAAIDCGYSPKTATVQASRLLSSVKGKEEVERRLEAMGMSKTEVAARLSMLARADVADFFKEEVVVHTPKLLRPVRELIAELDEEIRFEAEYAMRVGLSDEVEAMAEAWKQYAAEQQARKNRLLRLKMLLERAPHTKLLAVGAPVEVVVQKLDLTQARERGVLHLLKSSKPTKYGESIELYPVDGALRDVAKWRGLFVNQVEVTSKTSPRELTDAELATIAAGKA